MEPKKERYKKQMRLQKKKSTKKKSNGTERLLFSLSLPLEDAANAIGEKDVAQ
jgi:hypothetical protein